MPGQFTNTPESLNLPITEKIEIAQGILRHFDLVHFVNEDKISHFCYEITAKKCSSKGYPRLREYSIYDPDLRVDPPANSFTATLRDFNKFMKRDMFKNEVMKEFDCPIITYQDFVENQDRELKKVADYYGVIGDYSDAHKKTILLNPDYTNIFTNYDEICEWFTTYSK